MKSSKKVIKRVNRRETTHLRIDRGMYKLKRTAKDQETTAKSLSEYYIATGLSKENDFERGSR